jgi:hypothetical protein
MQPRVCNQGRGSVKPLLGIVIRRGISRPTALALNPAGEKNIDAAGMRNATGIVSSTFVGRDQPMASPDLGWP